MDDDIVRPRDIVVSQISAETARIIEINMPYVTVRYKADPQHQWQRLYKDFRLKSESDSVEMRVNHLTLSSKNLVNINMGD